MALPMSQLQSFVNDANKILLNKNSSVWIVKDDLLIPKNQSFLPSHGFSLQNKKPRSAANIALLNESEKVCSIKIRGQKFISGTINEIKISLLINVEPVVINFQYDTQVGDSKKEIINGLRSVIANAMNENPTLLNSRFFSSNKELTKKEISKVLWNTFGSVPFLEAEEGEILLNFSKCFYKDKVAIATEVYRSCPSPLISFNYELTPEIDKEKLYYLGKQKNFNIVANPNEITLNDFKYRFCRITQLNNIKVSFDLFGRNKLNSLDLLSTDLEKVYQFTNIKVPKRFGIVFVSESKDIFGAYNAIVLYSLDSKDLSINKINNNNSLSISLSPKCLNRQGDPIGYILKSVKSIY